VGYDGRLLYNDECSVCRRIAAWVKRSAQDEDTGARGLVERPIGDDPAELESLRPGLDIWDAYATIHLVMPDGSMKLGGEAVAEVLRRLPATRWFARMFSIDVWGFRPFQCMLNICYAILADIRPLFGCESCGSTSRWMRPVAWAIKSLTGIFGGRRPASIKAHFAPLPLAARSGAGHAEELVSARAPRLDGKRG
jgi:predicted DCC family thiol-disulfide oxidoreductase YuxK